MNRMKMLALSAFAAGAVMGTAFAADPIKIGVYLPLTGNSAFGGQLELEGAQLAHEKFPTIMNRPVELIVVDNKSDKVESANAVQRLVDKEKVVAIIGSFGSSLSMAGGEVAESAHIPMVGTSCSNPMVTMGKKYVFRAGFIDPYQGAGAAGWAIEKMGAKTAAILQEVSNDYSVGLAKFFKDAFEKKGGKIVAISNFQTGDQDFTAQLTEIISHSPDVLYIPINFAEGAIIMRQARELGGEFKIMGADAMDNPEMAKIAGDACEGFTFTAVPYAREMPGKTESAELFTKYWDEHHTDEPSALSALGYDCYLMIKDAIERTGSTDPEKITEGLATIKDLPCATGLTTINATHDAEKAVGIVQIINGKRTFVGTQATD